MMDYLSDESDDLPLPIDIWKRSLETKNGILSTVQEAIALHSNLKRLEPGLIIVEKRETKSAKNTGRNQGKIGEPDDESNCNDVEKENAEKKRKIVKRRQKNVRNNKRGVRSVEFPDSLEANPDETGSLDQAKKIKIETDIVISVNTPDCASKSPKLNNVPTIKKEIVSPRKSMKKETESSDTEVEEDRVAPSSKTKVKIEYNSGSDTEIEDAAAPIKTSHGVKTEQVSDSDTDIDENCARPGWNKAKKSSSGSDTELDEKEITEKSKKIKVEYNQNNNLEKNVATKEVVSNIKTEYNSGSDTEIEDNESGKESRKSEVECDGKTELDENVPIEKSVGKNKTEENSGSDTEIEDNYDANDAKYGSGNEKNLFSKSSIDEKPAGSIFLEQDSGSDTEIEDQVSTDKFKPSIKIENNSGSETDLDQEPGTKSYDIKSKEDSGSDTEIEVDFATEKLNCGIKTETNSGSDTEIEEAAPVKKSDEEKTSVKIKDDKIGKTEISENPKMVSKHIEASVNAAKPRQKQEKSFTSLSDIFFNDEVVKKKPPPKKKLAK